MDVRYFLTFNHHNLCQMWLIRKVVSKEFSTSPENDREKAVSKLLQLGKLLNINKKSIQSMLPYIVENRILIFIDEN